MNRFVSTLAENRTEFIPTLLFSAVLFIVNLQPVSLITYAWNDGGLDRVEYPGEVQQPSIDDYLDLNMDGIPEIVRNFDPLSVIQDGKVVWESPSNWKIIQYRIGDLDQDGKSELILLVRRPYQQIRINDYLPRPWLHPAYRYPDGDTCHIILIGTQNGVADELWAGSGLVHPMSEIHILDLDLDGHEELVGVEYAISTEEEEAGYLSVWRWQGFGFTLLERKRFSVLGQTAVIQTAHQPMLVVSGREDAYSENDVVSYSRGG